MITSWCSRIEESAWFQNSIIAVILFAAVLVGLETYPTFRTEHSSLLHFLDGLVLAIFSVEILIKLLARFPRSWRFFYDGWNVFDFIIVAACFVPAFTQYAMVLRMLRLLRILRLVRAIPRLQVVVGALLRSFPSMFYVSILLGMLFYMYAVMSTFLFSVNDPVHFGNLQTSLISLFRIVTLEDWTDIMYTQMYGCDVYGFGTMEELCTSPMAFPVLAPAFFISFVLIGTMIFLNLFIGVIVNGMDEARKEQEVERIRALSKPPKSLEEELHGLEEILEATKIQILKVKKASHLSPPQLPERNPEA